MLTMLDIIDLNDIHEFPDTPFQDWSDKDKDIIVSEFLDAMSVESVADLYDESDVYCGDIPAPYVSLMSECKNKIYARLESHFDLNEIVDDALHGFVWDKADAMTGVPVHDL